MALTSKSLDERYDLSAASVFVTGSQAIVRLTLMQRALDAAAGLDTAGYVTGYRGSPLGGLDQQFARAGEALAKANVRFHAAVNEDMAATALWGTQQAEMRGEGRHDGVFGVWYGKGPGVDRTGDVFRHANMAGTSRHGGVLVLMGDDHGAESSTVPHQSEFALVDSMLPILNPAGLQEIVDYGLLGLAMSRFSGLWVGLKCVHDTVESTGVIDAALERQRFVIPDVPTPPDGLNIRARDDRFAQERRLHQYKLPAAAAFAAANRVDRIVFAGGRAPKVGVIAAGKSFLDVRQALEDLGVDEARAAKLGLRLAKAGLVWPLSAETVRAAASGLDVLIVVEEKRALIEPQVREALYGVKAAPAVVGKKDEDGRDLFPAWGTLEPNAIAAAIGARLLPYTNDTPLAARLDAVRATIGSQRNAPDLAQRIPYFCAGCPHNSSTVVPDGGRGYAGIGCHWMVQFIPARHTEGATHMGGEGANWIGEAPFSTRAHVFQNMGDGTYNHSGLMAIRAACAADANITYKILFNDAVAMTGGQSHDTRLSPEVIAAQVRAEGVERIAVVSDEPEKYQASRFPAQVTFHHRDDIQPVQEELMGVKGVSVLIYDQTCAAEKRRRRKRGAFPDPARRVVINELVCEGCGDCGVQSNCVAIAPVETPFGRKRRIDQSVCNKDFSCLKGFCPSFVTVEGGELVRGVKRTPAETSAPFPVLPEPMLPRLAKPWSILVTGIGGTGVVTVGHILGMAAHLDGKGAGLIDMAGLSQKNGAVVTHVKIAERPQDIAAIRIAAGGADLILGCDLVTSASERILATADRGRTAAVVNAHETMPAQFTRDADFRLPGEGMRLRIEAACDGRASFFDATVLATELLGDSIAANLMTLGYAWQKGLVPLAEASILKAIEINGAAVTMNTAAFAWGRRAAHDPAAVAAVLGGRSREAGPERETLDEMIARRRDFLAAYQNASYADDYAAFVAKARAAEQAAAPGSQALTGAVARYLFKLMAYKDEYEVARLYTDGAFERAVREAFTGDYRLKFHLAPPLVAARDASGHLTKRAYGPWMMTAFRALARLKGLRGTAFDPFGYTAERKTERALIGEYRSTIEELLAGLTRDRLGLAAGIAAFPETIRGYGHVKERHLAETRARLSGLLTQWRSGAGEPARQAAE